jgi:hypothetical protein
LVFLIPFSFGFVLDILFVAPRRQCPEKKNITSLRSSKTRSQGPQSERRSNEHASRTPEGKKGDGSSCAASNAATVALRSNHRGAQEVWNYVVHKFYNFVTYLIIY